MKHMQSMHLDNLSAHVYLQHARGVVFSPSLF